MSDTANFPSLNIPSSIKNIVSVGPDNNFQFSSIETAINAAIDKGATSDFPFLIYIYPGEYTLTGEFNEACGGYRLTVPNGVILRSTIPTSVHLLGNLNILFEDPTYQDTTFTLSDNITHNLTLVTLINTNIKSQDLDDSAYYTIIGSKSEEINHFNVSTIVGESTYNNTAFVDNSSLFGVNVLLPPVLNSFNIFGNASGISDLPISGIWVTVSQAPGSVPAGKQCYGISAITTEYETLPAWSDIIDFANISSVDISFMVSQNPGLIITGYKVYRFELATRTLFLVGTINDPETQEFHDDGTCETISIANTLHGVTSIGDYATCNRQNTTVFPYYNEEFLLNGYGQTYSGYNNKLILRTGHGLSNSQGCNLVIRAGSGSGTNFGGSISLEIANAGDPENGGDAKIHEYLSLLKISSSTFGSSGKIGFFGVTPVELQTLADTSTDSAKINSIIIALTNYGLLPQG